MMLFNLGIFALIAAGLALAAWLASALLRGSSGLPQGRVVYSDSRGEGTRLLYSRRYGLSGKPDYLVDEGAGRVAPVEVKSARAPRSGRPHRSHLMQLACYCLLVEEDTGREVTHGYVKYRDRTIKVLFSADLKADLLDTLGRMRGGGGRLRDHADPRRCAFCSLAHVCDQKLAG